MVVGGGSVSSLVVGNKAGGSNVNKKLETS